MSKIYSLVSIDKECPSCQYIEAVSYNKSTLQEMLDRIDPNKFSFADFIIKEHTPVYSLLTTYTTDGQHKAKYFLHSNSSLKFNSNELYGCNKITTNGCENVLLCISEYKIDELKKQTHFKYDLSKNKILFDLHYDEGIMNA